MAEPADVLNTRPVEEFRAVAPPQPAQAPRATQTMTPTATDPLAEIRRLYFETKPSTILRDFDRAIDLLKMLPTEAERERATVYMEGLAEMRKEFGKGEGDCRLAGSYFVCAATLGAGTAGAPPAAALLAHCDPSSAS